MTVLGSLHFEKGGGCDPVEGLKRFFLAPNKGFSVATIDVELAKRRMTPEQIAEAIDRARAF